MEEKFLLDLLYQSMQDSAREARLYWGVHHRGLCTKKPYNR